MSRSDRALLLDYGGVMTTSVLDSFGAFCADEGIDVEVFRGVMLGAARTPDSVFTRVETGAIEQDEFDREVARMLTDACGSTIDPVNLKQRMFAGARLEQRMAGAVRTVRAAGVPTVLVSNSWGGRDYPDGVLEELFDHALISGLIGLRKPDPAIYLLAAERAGVAPESCVFVDDFRVNVEGAEAVGMTGIVHRDPSDTLARVERILGIDLSGGAG